MSPTISVIVPMYQAARTVADTLRSLAAITVHRIEVLVVNDGSTDGGPRLVAELARRDPRFRMIAQPNAGLAAARNTGIDASRGEYLYFLDADDIVHPRGLAALLDRASRSRLNAVFGRVEWLDSNADSIGWAPLLDHHLAEREHWLRGCLFPVNACLIRRDAVADTRFDPSLRIGEDWDFWLRLAERGLTWHGFDVLVAGYRMTPGSLSRRPRDMHRALAATVGTAHERAAAPGALRRAIADELAIEWATAGLSDSSPSRVADCVDLLHDTGVRRVNPELAATKAFHRLAWMHCFSPAMWEEPPPRALGAAIAFWRAIERHGLASDTFAEHALESLAGLAATPSLIARTIADRLTHAPLTILGLGRNARAVARELHARDIPFAGADDRMTSPPQWAEDLEIPLTVTDPANIPELGTLILSMADDAEPWKRHAARRTIRWREVHADLQSRISMRSRRSIDDAASAGLTAHAAA